MAKPDSARIDAIKRTLRDNSWDAFLLFHPDNILMASGMLPGSTHVATLVMADGHVVIITPWWRESFVREESWADEVIAFDWCKPFGEPNPLAALVELIRKCKEELGIGKVGFDGKMHHYSPNKLPSEFFDYAEVKQQLPDIFPLAVDATDAINDLKSVKTEMEIGRLRLTHEVAAAGVRAFYETAKPGMKESDLAAEVNYAILKMVGHKGIRYVYCDPPQISSGAERTVIADTMSNHATDRQLLKGDPVMLEFGVHADGYWADITRCLIVGGPQRVHERIHEGLLAAQQSAFAAYEPLASTGGQLCEAAWKALRDAGLARGITHGLGHGLGFAYHEDRPTLGPGSTDLIRPGFVTSVEPGIYWRGDEMPLAGIRIEDNVVWGKEKGQVEILSNFYRGLDTCWDEKTF